MSLQQFQRHLEGFGSDAASDAQMQGLIELLGSVKKKVIMQTCMRIGGVYRSAFPEAARGVDRIQHIP